MMCEGRRALNQPQLTQRLLSARDVSSNKCRTRIDETHTVSPSMLHPDPAVALMGALGLELVVGG